MISASQRLAAALKGERLDRIPVFCNLIDQGARELGMSIRQYYSRGANVAEGQLRLVKKYGHDNFWSLFYVGREAVMLGCDKINFPDDGPPNVADFIIKTPEDIKKLHIPDDIYSHPEFQEEIECIRIMRKETEGRYPVIAYLTSALTLPCILMGMEKWFKLLLFGPAELRDELLNKCCEFFRKHLAAYKKAGADVFLYSEAFGSTDFVPMKMFREFCLPWIEKDLEGVDPQRMVYYCGSSRLNPVIDAILERTRIEAFYPGPLDDAAKSGRILNDRALFAGVFNDIRLIEWTPGEIRSEVKRIITAGMKSKKFIFGTSVIPCCVPETKIRVLLDAALEFGVHERR